MPILFGNIRRWLDGRSLGTGKCHRLAALAGHRRDAYFYDFEPRERGHHGRPSRPPDLRGLDVLIFEPNADLQADSLALDVLELQEGLLGKINGLLDVR